MTATGVRPSVTDAVLFDLDGTLVDSVDLHARAWTEALHYFGVEAAFEAVRAQIGKGGDQLMPLFVPEDMLKARGEALDAYRSALYRERYQPLVKPFAGVPELFNRLRRRGTRIAIASSSKRADLDRMLRLLSVEQLIDVAVGGDDVATSKPAPDVFLAGLEKLGCRADGSVAVGDSPWDAMSARAAGLRTVGVRSGGFPDNKLREAGCMAIYDDVEALCRTLEDSPLA